MARIVICLSMLALGLCVAAPASADNATHGYIAVSKVQIDPHMITLSDGPSPRQAAPQNDSNGQDTGTPLDQLDDPDANGPAGDDPYADNAVETDTVYSI